MIVAVHRFGAACLLAGLLVAPMLPPHRTAAAQSTPLSLTTDTPEYCRHLIDLLSRKVRAAAGPLAPDVSVLSSDVRRMCDEGQVRRGILRLRRELVLMQSPP